MKHNSPFGEFVWFQGVIEDLNDPKKANRVRVRCIGYHTEDLTELPVDALPWAPFSGFAGEGAPRANLGDWVWGFFIDGEEAQKPMVVGVIPGIPTDKADTTVGFNDPTGVHPRRTGVPTNSHAARGEKDVADYKAKTAWENPVEFGAVYPFNKVIETDKGAMFELDDTEGAERVHIFHHKGSYVEFLPDGTIVVKSIKDRWDVTFSNHTMLVNGNLKIGATGDVAIAAGGDLKLSAGGNLAIAAGSDLALGGGGAGSFVVGGTLGLKGSTLDAQGSASDASGGPDPVSAPGDTSPYSPPEEGS